MTLAFSDVYIDRVKNPLGKDTGLTWEKILAEEPFEGQHWEGAYGLPPGSVKRTEDWDARSDRSGGSTPSLSPWDDEDDMDEELSSPAYSPHSVPGSGTPPSPMADEHADHVNAWNTEAYRYSYLYEVEDLQSRQYWKPEWRNDTPTDMTFNVGQASSLGTVVEGSLVKTA